MNPRAGHADELLARYHEALALVQAQPGEHVRASVLAQAQILAAPRADDEADLRNVTPGSTEAVETTRSDPTEVGFAAESIAPMPWPEAVNDRRWRISAIASVAVLGLAGLLALQFERSPPDDGGLAGGTPASTPTSDTGKATLPAAATEAEQSHPARASTPAPTTATTQAPRPKNDTHPTAARAPKRPPTPAPAAPPLPSPFPASQADALEAGAVSQAVTHPPAASLAETGPTKPVPGPTSGDAPTRQPNTMQDAGHESARAAPLANPGDRLLEAARRGDVEALRTALAEGASTAHRDRTGRDALMLAAGSGNQAAVQLLLAAGAEPARTDHEGRNAAEHARRAGHRALASWLDDRTRVHR